MERPEITTEHGDRPSRRFAARHLQPGRAGDVRSVLMRSAGWLALLLMLALASPGVRVEPASGHVPVAHAVPDGAPAR